jgi:flavin-binding protein dodecin
MSKLHASLATVLDSTPTDEPTASDAARADVSALEFVGASDETIAEAVRRALSNASISLRTLDGVGVVVIPQIDHHGARPRYQVTLRISPAAAGESLVAEPL